MSLSKFDRVWLVAAAVLVGILMVAVSLDTLRAEGYSNWRVARPLLIAAGVSSWVVLAIKHRNAASSDGDREASVEEEL